MKERKSVSSYKLAAAIKQSTKRAVKDTRGRHWIDGLNMELMQSTCVVLPHYVVNKDEYTCSALG